jgi:hypothetical protein
MNQVVIRLLPDGSGRVRIHWFVHDPKGPVRTPASTTMTALGPLRLGGAVGRIACQPGLESVTPKVDGTQTVPLCHSDDCRAATCPECMATPEYAAAMKRLSEILELPTSEGDVRRAAAVGVG